MRKGAMGKYQIYNTRRTCKGKQIRERSGIAPYAEGRKTDQGRSPNLLRNNEMKQRRKGETRKQDGDGVPSGAPTLDSPGEEPTLIKHKITVINVNGEREPGESLIPGAFLHEQCVDICVATKTHVRSQELGNMEFECFEEFEVQCVLTTSTNA